MSPEFYAAWIASVEASTASKTKTKEQKQAEFGDLLTRYRAHGLLPTEDLHRRGVWANLMYIDARQTTRLFKNCHCQGCQVTHGAPFQWAAIFHKNEGVISEWHNWSGVLFLYYESQGYQSPTKVDSSSHANHRWRSQHVSSFSQLIEPEMKKSNSREA